MSEDAAVARIPANLAVEEAAALSFGGTTALYFLRKVKLRGGERVLINGAAGGVGTAAVQLARCFDVEVTGVCSAANIELLRSLGADQVIDYRKQDFTEHADAYDVIIDAVGNVPISRCMAALKAGGRLVLVVAGLPELLRAPLASAFRGKKIFAGPVYSSADDLRFLADFAQKGKFRPVIDRRYPLEEIVEAHRYVDTGRKKGNVVICLARDCAAPSAPF